MRVPKIIVNSTSQSSTQQQLAVSGQNYHHLINVLRCKPKDIIEVSFAESTEVFRAQIVSVDAKQNLLVIQLIEELQPVALNSIDLICGFPKPATAEFIVEKAIEIGVSNIHFFFAERSQNYLRGEQLQKKLARLDKIKESALKQSGLVNEAIKIQIHNNLQIALKAAHSESFKMIFVAPSDEQQQLPTVIDLVNSNSNHSQQHRFYSVIIGPEGGLSSNEIELAKGYNFVPASLGNKTLRVETAVIAGCALLQLL